MDKLNFEHRIVITRHNKEAERVEKFELTVS